MKYRTILWFPILFAALLFLSACSLDLSKKDDPVEQTKNYVVGLKADEIKAQIISAQNELSQLNQMMNAFGPIGAAGENYLEKASSTKIKILELQDKLKEVEKFNQ